MKKVLIIIIVLLSFGVIGFGIFYVATHDFSVDRNNDGPDNVELNEGTPEVEKENNVTLVSTEEIDGSFVQTYNIVMNGKEKTLEVEFLYRDNQDLKEQSLTGEFSGATVYAYYDNYEDEADGFDENMIASSFNENNFSFISGVNGESYLIIYTNIYDDGTGEEDKLFILNDDLEFVSNDLVDYAGSSDTKGMTIMSTYTGYTLENDEYPWYNDSFNACTTPSNCYIDVKIEDNQIYYLVPVLNTVSEEANEDDEEDNEEATDYGELEERVYRINNNKLEYEVIQRYKITGVNGLTE